MSYCWHQCSR